MNIKNYDDFKINESLEDIFKEKTYKEKVINYLTNIITTIKGISEKSFQLYDIKIEKIQKLLKNIDLTEYENKNYRVEYTGEILFQKYKKKFMML